MNSALKPVLPAGGPSAGGQASPAKANVAANHSVALPQGAQNHAQNNLAVQNLTHHPPAAPQQPHAPAPSMAPVTANMAQMAQNMSHHGNLSHATQNSNNSAPPANNSAPSPSKPATSAPLSLVQDKALEKPNTQPLALTRTPEKKEAEPSNQSNGTVESPRVAANAPAPLKPQNPELMKEKQDIGKASPSTPKPPEKPTNAPSTPQKTEVANAVGQVDGPAYAKMAPANEAPEKSPAKAVEPKPAPTADVAPSQSDSKPAPESAKDPQPQVKPVTPQKPAPSNAESAKPDIAPKVEEKKEEAKPEILATEVKKEEVKVDAVDEPKKEAPAPPVEKPEEKVEEKKVETSKPTKAEAKVAKSTIKLATVNTPVRKRRQTSPNKIDTPAAKKAAVGVETPESSKNKRNRTQVQLYQSPTPELTMATKLSASAGRSTPTKPNDDKLIVFYKNEYLAVRNAEGAFYVCQAMQNVYRSTRKIKIRWLSQDKADPKGVTYKPDFYDVTDMECVLTTLSLTKAGGGAQTLKPAEQARAKSILDRAIAAERSGNKPAPADLTEEHPDGLDLSLYRDESQLDKLDKKTRKRGGDKGSPRARQSDSAADSAEEATPAKRARTAAKRGRPAAKAKASPKPLPKPSPKPGANATKRKAAGSPPSKTAAVVTEKPATPKTTPAKASKPAAKKTPAKPAKADTPAKPKVETPATKGRRAVREVKPIVPTPSTSTGKTTRTPRKPPSKK